MLPEVNLTSIGDCPFFILSRDLAPGLAFVAPRRHAKHHQQHRSQVSLHHHGPLLICSAWYCRIAAIPARTPPCSWCLRCATGGHPIQKWLTWQ